MKVGTTQVDQPTYTMAILEFTQTMTRGTSYWGKDWLRGEVNERGFMNSHVEE